MFALPQVFSFYIFINWTRDNSSSSQA